MKFVIFLAVLAVAIACAFACDPAGNNKPDCAGGAAEKSRNFHDVNAYWSCEGGEAQLERCPDEKCYSAAAGDCVPCPEFEWTEPCSD